MQLSPIMNQHRSYTHLTSGVIHERIDHAKVGYVPPISRTNLIAVRKRIRSHAETARETTHWSPNPFLPTAVITLMKTTVMKILSSVSPCQEARPRAGGAYEEYARSHFPFPTTPSRPLTVMAPCSLLHSFDRYAFSARQRSPMTLAVSSGVL